MNRLRTILALMLALAALLPVRGAEVAAVRITTVRGVLPMYIYLPAPDKCWGASIAGNSYVPGRMVVTVGSDTVYDSGEWADGQGMRLKIRGNTSAFHPFPSYKVKLSSKHDLMGLGCREKDWLLMSVHAQRDQRYALLNNLTGCQVATMLGMDWQPRYMFVELYINGDYRGLYQLCDPVERADTRCKIKKSGFLIENDAYWWKEKAGTWFRVPGQIPQLAFTFKYPDDELLTDSVVAQTKTYMTAFADSLMLGGSISDILDLRAAAAWILAHDLLGIQDTHGSNMYMHKYGMGPKHQDTSPLVMGPLWDFDTAFQIDRSFSEHHSRSFFFMNGLFKRAEFLAAYKQLWDSVRTTVVSSIDHVADSLARHYGPALDLAIKRSNARRLEYVLPLAESAYNLHRYAAKRVAWLDERIARLRLPLVYTTHKPLRLYTLNGVYLGQFADYAELLRLRRGNGVYIYTDGKRRATITL